MRRILLLFATILYRAADRIVSFLEKGEKK